MSCGKLQPKQIQTISLAKGITMDISAVAPCCNAEPHLVAFTQLCTSCLGLCEHICDGDCLQHFEGISSQTVGLWRSFPELDLKCNICF